MFEALEEQEARDLEDGEGPCRWERRDECPDGDPGEHDSAEGDEHPEQRGEVAVGRSGQIDDPVCDLVREQRAQGGHEHVGGSDPHGRQYGALERWPGRVTEFA